MKKVLALCIDDTDCSPEIWRNNRYLVHLGKGNLLACYSVYDGKQIGTYFKKRFKILEPTNLEKEIEDIYTMGYRSNE